MLDIKITHEPNAELYDYYFFEDSEITIPEDATATNAVYAFVKAMTIEGYAEKSIANALSDVADDLAFENHMCDKDEYYV